MSVLDLQSLKEETTEKGGGHGGGKSGASKHCDDTSSFSLLLCR